MLIGSPSASRLTTFSHCNFKYMMTYSLNLRDQMRSNFGACRGSIFHTILEKYATGEDRDWLKLLYQGWAGELKANDRQGNEKILPSPLIYAKDKDFKNKPTPCDTCPMRDILNNRCGISHEPLDKLSGCPIDLFHDSADIMGSAIARYSIYFDNPDCIVGVEYQCKVPVTGIDEPMTCIFDLVIKEDEDTVHIIDYKGGAKTKNYDELMQDLQARSYFFAGYLEFISDISQKGHKFKNILVTFDYFQASPVTIVLTQQQRIDIEQEIKNRTLEVKNTKIIQRIVGNREPDPNNRSDWMCRYLCDIDLCKQQWNKLVDEGKIVNGAFHEQDQ
jgi:PD-(D/E)XK nuclease superfamily protein